MQNFTYFNPTRLFFGKGQIASIASAIPRTRKVLMLYGGGSIKQNGVYDQVKAALKDHTVLEFGGIEPNPHYETLMRAVELIRREGVDYLLAVGGGSVADGSKFIAAAACYDGADAWDLVAKNLPIAAALPLGCVLTLPATGSESNAYAVITHAEKQLKLGIGSPLLYPTFAVLDPETTFTLPARQIGNGIVDAFVHVMEQYMTYPVHAPLQDRYAESILQTLIEVGPKTLAQPTDYEARASYMWAANQALNGLIAVGVPQDWATHMIGHEITAEYGLDHAQALATVLPHLLQVLRSSKREKLLQFAARVWHLTEGAEDARIDAAIAQTAAFFESMGLKTRLASYGIGRDAGEIIAKRLQAIGYVALGEQQAVTPDVVKAILARSLV